MEMKKHQRRARRKLPFLKFCSCMSVDQEEFPESCKPYVKSEKTSSTSSPPTSGAGNTEGSLEDQIITQDVTSGFPPPPHRLEPEESLEPAPDIEIPPPMPVQDQSHIMNIGKADGGDNLADKIQPDTSSERGQASDSGGEEDKEAEKEKCLKKRQYVITELIETEQDYVKDLGSVVEGYKGHIEECELPEDMKEKCKIVFGNIHQIYDFHKETFSEELQKCLEEPDRLAGLFLRYERRLGMYVKYCENKPKSEYIVSEYIDGFFEEIRQKLGHRLNLADLLIKPVQRIMKYQLILKDILKYTERAGLDIDPLRRAYHVMCVVPKDANDMMQFGRLQGYDGKITAVGKLLLQGNLSVAELTGNSVSRGQLKFKDRRVFLFEQIVLFSEMTEKKRGNIVSEYYLFKNSLKVNKMSMTDNWESDPLKFILRDLSPGADVKFVIQAPSEDVKTQWVSAIQKILEMQGDFLRALQSPIAYYNKDKELTKEFPGNVSPPVSAPELGNSSKDGQLRKTHSQPHPSRGSNSAQNSLKGRNQEDTHNKHYRCKSVPTPLNEVVTTQDKSRVVANVSDVSDVEPQNCSSDGLSLLSSDRTDRTDKKYVIRESSCPNTPTTECSKGFLQKKTAKSSSSTSFKDGAVDFLSKSKGFHGAGLKSKDNGEHPTDLKYATPVGVDSTGNGNQTVESPSENGNEGLENEQNLCWNRILKAFANSLDPDETLQNVASHQDPNCLLF